MHEEIVRQLLDLNRGFYERFAEVFAASRGTSEPGLARILQRVGPNDRILDLGCGQGRLAYLVPHTAHYVGVDYAPAMLRIATSRVLPTEHSTFITADLIYDDWETHLGTQFDQFDWIFMRAVLHHIPSYRHRQQILSRAKLVLAPSGTVVLANWQFLNIPRLQKRLLPWSTIGLEDGDVEPGDYLLDWQRQGHGLRYVHLINEVETQQLAADSGLRIIELFRADGHTNDLTLYALLRR